MSQSFGKDYKLCSKYLITETYNSGKRLKSFPLLLRYKKTKLKTNVPFQVVISVPKRKFKLAVKRNRIKRQLREAIRKNKLNLEECLKKNNMQMALFVVYRHHKEVEYQEIDTKIEHLLSLIIKDINTED